MVVHTTGFASLIRNNRASAATRDHDDDPNDASIHSGRFDNFIIVPVPGLDDDPRSPIYIPREYEEVESIDDDDDDFDPHEWIARMGRMRLDDSDSDSGFMYYNNNRPLYTTEEFEETNRRRDDDDDRNDWPSYYFSDAGSEADDDDFDPHEWYAQMRRDGSYITPDSDSDDDFMYYNNNPPLYTTEEFKETDRRRDDHNDRNDCPRCYFSDSESNSDTNLTYNNINRPIHGPEEVEEADERIDDDDYYPGGIRVRPGKYTPGTGQVIPEKFTPPNPSTRPQDLFPPGRRMDTSPPVRRFISRLNPNEMLIYTDGACLGNGQANPRAGCGVVFREARPGRRGHLAVPLERQGPTGHPRPQTSNRAELRAAIMALQFRYWPGEGWTKVVIATDSEYVVEGATSWVKGWLRNGWRTRSGRPVKNKDLWKCLLGCCEELATTRAKTKVEFWRIPREWNAEADGWAKHAAAQDERATVFLKLSGVLI
ncbi:hypothetical protein CDV55_102055 [Aspergillus turcosus]|uniref:ribonuclease H n=1 Tax=Aspergillus turcosus TaxID=1245748 RepID=A0A229X1I0_9EURO|nr:hypothetical protein CDV55_102055 [Aspergillus turcosus]RLL94435.1 hypothetical protein CFD26_103285 [Aspergillus turcosus]